MWLKTIDLYAQLHPWFWGDKDAKDSDVPGIVASILPPLRDGGVPRRILARFARVKTIEGFDTVINSLYDWADANRVWIEK